MDIHLKNIKFWLVWVMATTLSSGLCLSIGGWAAGLDLQHAYSFNLSFPSSLSSLSVGFIVGLVQWILVHKRQDRKVIQWMVGATLGIFLVSEIGLACFDMATWAHFKESWTTVEEVQEIARSAALGGLFGGAILGAIQGSTRRTWMSWSLVNAVAWAVGWGTGRTVTHLIGARKYWYLHGLAEPLQLAIQLGVLGTVSGFVSSSITGIFVLKVFPRVSN